MANKKTGNLLFRLILLTFLTISVASPFFLMGDGKEIRNYQGKKLSSINDFRENSIKGPQKVDIKKYRLEISGEVDKPYALTYEEVLSHFKPVKKVFTMYCVEGWELDLLWEGFRLRDILAKAGVRPDAKTVIFHSTDGYSTSIQLDYIYQHDLLLAYKINGLTIPAERGYPFQVAAEGKWGYKWAKWVQKIEVSKNIAFKGYWEERGYNSKGDISGPIFE